ncbi:MAG: hypothetical protein AAFR46_06255 [Pseudomonadota bacterium]
MDKSIHDRPEYHISATFRLAGSEAAVDRFDPSSPCLWTKLWKPVFGRWHTNGRLCKPGNCVIETEVKLREEGKRAMTPHAQSPLANASPATGQIAGLAGTPYGEIMRDGALP